MQRNLHHRRSPSLDQTRCCKLPSCQVNWFLLPLTYAHNSCLPIGGSRAALHQLVRKGRGAILIAPTVSLVNIAFLLLRRSYQPQPRSTRKLACTERVEILASIPGRTNSSALYSCPVWSMPGNGLKRIQIQYKIYEADLSNFKCILIGKCVAFACLARQVTIVSFVQVPRHNDSHPFTDRCLAQPNQLFSYRTTRSRGWCAIRLMLIQLIKNLDDGRFR